MKSGNTPLIADKKLSLKYGASIFIKDESKNPFGTYKDRRSELIVEKAKDEHVDKLVLITSGNSGYSLARFAKGIKVVCVIDKKLKKPIKNKLDKYSKIIEIDLSLKILKPEEIISLSRSNEKEVIWDVTNGFHDTYESIISEIKIVKPDFVIVSVGSGQAFVGLYGGIKKFKLKTKLIGVSVKEKWSSFADKLHTPWTPYESKIKSILKEGHEIIKLSEEEVRRIYFEYENKYPVEPSSSVVFEALNKLKFKKTDKVVLINSGKGLK